MCSVNNHALAYVIGANQNLLLVQPNEYIFIEHTFDSLSNDDFWVTNQTIQMGRIQTRECLSPMKCKTGHTNEPETRVSEHPAHHPVRYNNMWVPADRFAI